MQPVPLQNFGIQPPPDIWSCRITIQHDIIDRPAFLVTTPSDYLAFKAIFLHVHTSGKEQPTQWHNALRVRLDGGYGMYYDLTEHDLVLCKECADGLVAYLGVDTIDSESA